MFTAANLFLLLKHRCSRFTCLLRQVVTGEGNLTPSIVRKSSYKPSSTQESRKVIYETQEYLVFSHNKEIVNLSNGEWTAYLGSKNQTSDKRRLLHVLLSTSRPTDEEKFLSEIVSIPDNERLELLSACKPVAWRPGDPYRIICSLTLEQYLHMADRLIWSCLVMDEMLQIDELSLVSVEGEATDLLPPESEHYMVRVESSSDYLIAQSYFYRNSSQGEDNSVERDDLAGGDNSRTAIGSDNNDVGDTNDVFTEKEAIRCISDVSLAELRAPAGGQLSKSPNVLIYIGKPNSAKLSDIKQMCASCLGTDSYTVYQLKEEHVRTTPWQENCHLLIIAKEMLYNGVDEVFYQFFAAGGNILSFCSNFDERLVALAEHESPNYITVSSCKFGSEMVKAVQGRHYYTEPPHALTSSVEYRVISANSNDQAVVVDVSNSKGGQCILSQIHLERSPSEYSVNKEILSQLTSTEPGRKSALKLLMERLGLVINEDPRQSEGLPACTKCYLLFTSSELPNEDFISKVTTNHRSKIQDGCLIMPNKTEYQLEADPRDVEDSFNWQEYRLNLAGRLGNTVIYQQISATTQKLLEPFMFSAPKECGLIATAQRQLSGVGRGQNQWLSPLGSMSLSMHVKLDMMSNLGRAPALIQTIPAVAVCRVISSLINMHCIEERVKVKWPNDIYVGKVKVGGVIVQSSVLQNTMSCIVGVGVNVTNSKPTVNVNQTIEEYNSRTGENISSVSVEFLTARVCSEVERLIDIIQASKPEYMKIYYENWMHEGGVVDVPSEEVSGARILGLDEHGFLLLRKEGGGTFSVQPDGNSFDIMHNLIRLK